MVIFGFLGPEHSVLFCSVLSFLEDEVEFFYGKCS